MENTNLSKASLQSARLVRANCRNAIFAESTCTNASFEGACLAGARFERTSGSGADLSDADLSGATLEAANFENGNLTRANLHQVAAEKVNLSSAELKGANLKDAHFAKAVFTNAHLDFATLSRADLRRANFHDATLDASQRYQADFFEADLSGASLSQVRGAEPAKRLETVRVSSDARYFDECERSRLSTYLDWERLRTLGRLPLFGFSYTVLILIPLYLFAKAWYNDKVSVARAWAERVEVKTPEEGALRPLHDLAVTVKARLHEIPIDSQAFLILVSTMLLATASTIYTFACPSRVKEFSRDQWCDQLDRSLLHYWSLAWRRPWLRIICAACYLLGGTGALWVIIVKVVRAGIYIWEHSRFSFL